MPDRGETPVSCLSDRLLEDPADLIDRSFLPNLFIFYIVSDADDLLQILSGQPNEGRLFPDMSLY